MPGSLIGLSWPDVFVRVSREHCRNGRRASFNFDIPPGIYCRLFFAVEMERKRSAFVHQGRFDFSRGRQVI